MTDDANRMPYWPAALNHKMATMYCGLSIHTFKKVCPVKPIRFTQSAWGERFLRQRLDEWLLSLDSNRPNFDIATVSLGDFFTSGPPKRKFGEGTAARNALEPPPKRRKKRTSISE